MNTDFQFFLLFPDIIRYAVAAATPLLFAAGGGMLTELAGMLNIALEGLIGLGAFWGMVAAGWSGSLLFGALAASLSGLVGALIMAAAVLRFRANIFIAGLAINLGASGITSLFSQLWYRTRAVVAFNVPKVPQLFPEIFWNIPILGPLVMSQNLISMASWLWILMLAFVIRTTRFGLRVRAAGMNEDAMRALGEHPDFYRFIALILSGIGCGLAGYSLGLSISAYVPNIASGRGWIALVAIYLGRSKAQWIAASCFLFAFAESISNYLQGLAFIPSSLVLVLPYAVTLLSLILGAVRAHGRQSLR